MKTILMVGQNVQALVRRATEILSQTTEIQITVYAPKTPELYGLTVDRLTFIEGTIDDAGALTASMLGQQAVYVDLAPEMPAWQVHHLLSAMQGAELNQVYVNGCVQQELEGQVHWFNRRRNQQTSVEWQQVMQQLTNGEINFTYWQGFQSDGQAIVSYGSADGRLQHATTQHPAMITDLVGDLNQGAA
ncbi:hypothetical protein [Levilactobacillus bambusae]|uniref:NAD(P)-binding domain-containing protein n=1 Tax=Levilactobacillus bambusae TaxID=2024736 RepID=A0A2V1N1H3_9LACO|nr:hypothetical protein [Levilactobacillus bambusae]PWG00235.1 hypothetical protein DCM90_04685 [Levilactobacillus bambusae]